MPTITSLPLELLLEVSGSLNFVDFCTLAHTRLDLSKSLLSSERYCRELTHVRPCGLSLLFPLLLLDG